MQHGCCPRFKSLIVYFNCLLRLMPLHIGSGLSGQHVQPVFEAAGEESGVAGGGPRFVVRAGGLVVDGSAAGSGEEGDDDEFLHGARPVSKDRAKGRSDGGPGRSEHGRSRSRGAPTHHSPVG